MQFVICIANQGRGRKHGVGLGAPRQQLKRSALQRSPRPCNQALTTAEWKSLWEEGVFHVVQSAQNVDAATINPANHYAHDPCAKDGDLGWKRAIAVDRFTGQFDLAKPKATTGFAQSGLAFHVLSGVATLLLSARFSGPATCADKKAVSLTSAQMANLRAKVRLGHAEMCMSISPSSLETALDPIRKGVKSENWFFETAQISVRCASSIFNSKKMNLIALMMQIRHAKNGEIDACKKRKIGRKQMECFQQLMSNVAVGKSLEIDEPSVA